jgi:hypothetical protein
MPARRRRSRNSDSSQQLLLQVAWLTEAEILGALRVRGATFVEEVRLRPNRSRLISLSADRRRLNLHECFRAAPARVLDAVATFATAPGRSRTFRDAVEAMREWHEGQVAEYGLGEPLANCGTPEQVRYLKEVYDQLNDSHFNGGLPRTLPIRLSDRMSRRFGHVSYARTVQGVRKVAELALNIDLLLPGNERALVDTLLHEMAHVEAWLVHGHREHGGIWRMHRPARRLRGAGVHEHAAEAASLPGARDERATAEPATGRPEPGDGAAKAARSGLRMRAARRGG